MKDETIEGIYRFVGGFLVGTLIGISWVDFHNPKAQMPDAAIPILAISILTGIALAILPKIIREGFWISVFPWSMPLPIFILIMVIVPLILMMIPHRKGGLIERILSNHWWNWL